MSLVAARELSLAFGPKVLLDRAALDFLRSIRYEPARQGAQACGGELTVGVTFSLSDY